MEQVSWGIIGCGDVTEVKSGPAFNKVPNSRLTAVMRRNGQLAEDYARRHGVPRWYDSAEELINDQEVNAIYIATPPDSHSAYAIEAMKAGKPVYVEKPMAINHSQTLQMIEASEKYNVKLLVAYYRRALPGFLKVKELVDSGRIGAVRTVNIQLYKSLSESELTGNTPWRVIPEIAGGGHFADLASHQLDYLDYLLGPVERVRSVTTNQVGAYPAEDLIGAAFKFNHNVVATGSWCFTVPEFMERDIIEIIGSEGAVRFSCFGFEPVVLVTSEGTETFDFPKPEHVQQNLIDLVVQELTGKGKSPSTGVSAARTNWVMDEVLKEYYEK